MTKPPAIDYKRLIRETNKARRRLIRKLPGVQIATYARAIRGLSLEDAARHEAGHVLVGALAGGIVLAAAVVQLPGGVDGIAVVWTKQTALFAVAGAVAQGVPWISAADALALPSVTTPQTAVRIVKEAMDHAGDLLSRHPRALRSLTAALVRHGTLDRPRILQILRRCSIQTRRTNSEARQARRAVSLVLEKIKQTFSPSPR